MNRSISPLLPTTAPRSRAHWDNKRSQKMPSNHPILEFSAASDPVAQFKKLRLLWSPFLLLLLSSELFSRISIFSWLFFFHVYFLGFWSSASLVPPLLFFLVSSYGPMTSGFRCVLPSPLLCVVFHILRQTYLCPLEPCVGIFCGLSLARHTWLWGWAPVGFPLLFSTHSTQ